MGPVGDESSSHALPLNAASRSFSNEARRQITIRPHRRHRRIRIFTSVCPRKPYNRCDRYYATVSIIHRLGFWRLRSIRFPVEISRHRIP